MSLLFLLALTVPNAASLSFSAPLLFCTRWLHELKQASMLPEQFPGASQPSQSRSLDKTRRKLPSHRYIPKTKEKSQALTPGAVRACFCWHVPHRRRRGLDPSCGRETVQESCCWGLQMDLPSFSNFVVTWFVRATRYSAAIMSYQRKQGRHMNGCGRDIIMTAHVCDL